MNNSKGTINNKLGEENKPQATNNIDRGPLLQRIKAYAKTRGGVTVSAWIVGGVLTLFLLPFALINKTVELCIMVGIVCISKQEIPYNSLI